MVHSGARAILGKLSCVQTCCWSIWISLAILVSLGCQADEATDSLSKLIGGEFHLEARVKINSESSSFTEEISVSEIYSSKLKRAKLRIHSQNRATGPAWHTLPVIEYYYLSTSGSLLKYSNESCMKASRAEFSKDLFGMLYQSEATLTGDKWLALEYPLPGHLIGFSRLLALIGDLRHSFVLDSTSDSRNQRNHAMVKYRLAPDKGFNPLFKEFNLYYAKRSARAPGSELEQDYPVKIWCVLLDDSELVAEFFSIRAVSLQGIEDNELGELTLPLNRACSRQLEPASLFGGAHKQVSGSLVLERWDTRRNQLLHEQFVAYDALRNVYRVDTMQAGEFLKPSRRKSLYTITIHDMKLERRLHMAMGEPQAADHDTDDASATRCFAEAPPIPAAADGRAPFWLAFDQFKLVEMGPTRVRGIWAVAFEQVGTQLPETLFPLFHFTDKQQAAGGGSQESMSYAGLLRGAEYSLTYHFSRARKSGAALGPLLRVDIGRSGEQLQRLEVYRFSFNLDDAPNGDSRRDLFSVRDRCLGAADFQSQLDVRLELEAQLRDDIVGRPEGEQAESLASAVEYLKDGFRRHDALARTLVASTPANAAQLFDLETRLASGAGAGPLRVVASAKLAAPERIPVYRAVYEGTTRVTRFVQFSEAKNLHDCFMEALRTGAWLKRPPETGITFALLKSDCIIDLPASSIDRVALEKADKSTKVYRALTARPEGAQEPSDSSLLDQTRRTVQRFRGLQGTALPIRLADDSPAVYMSVSRVHVAHNDWQTGALMPDRNLIEAGAAHRALAGVGLVPGAGGAELVEALKPSQAHVHSTDLLDLESPGMSLEVCQQTCLASLSCSSFSLCQTQDQLECVISPANLRNANTIGRLEAARSQLKQSGKRSTIKLELNAGAESASQSNGSSNPMELRVDKRCQSYTVNPLDAFVLVPVSSAHYFSAYIDTRHLTETSAKSEELCAEHCVQTNVGFFRALRDLVGSEKAPIKSGPPIQDTWCGSFVYLQDWQQSSRNRLPQDEAPKIDGQLSNSKSTSGELGESKNNDYMGACVVFSKKRTKFFSTEEIIEYKKEQANLRAKIGQSPLRSFKYSTLYRPIHGTRISGTSRQGPMNKPYLGSVDVAAKAMHESNWQTVTWEPDVEHCAKTCFTQAGNVELWCRSFTVKTPTRFQTGVKCILNSLTLKDIMSMQNGSHLIAREDSESGENELYVHYEPREAFQLDDYLLARRLASSQQESSATYQGSSGAFMGPLVVILAVVLATATAMLLVRPLASYSNSIIGAAFASSSGSRVTSNLIEPSQEASLDIAGLNLADIAT